MSITIAFDNPSKTFWAGSIISGKVHVNLDKPKNIRNITIGFKGITECRWTENHSRTRNGKTENYSRTFHGIDEHFSFKVVLLQHPDESPLPPGQHTYHFQYTLPEVLPPSFEGDYGSTKYRANANIDIPWAFDISTKEHLFIIPIMRLSEVPEGRRRFMIEKQKSIGVMCCASGHIVLTVTAPTSGFVCGEVVPINLDIQNSSDAVVYRTNVSIRKVVIFTAKSPYYKQRKVKSTILTNSIDTFVQAKKREFFNTKLQIPLTEASSMDECTVIQIFYFMKFECKIQGWHFNLKDEKKIVIATVPLPSASAPPLLQFAQ